MCTCIASLRRKPIEFPSAYVQVVAENKIADACEERKKHNHVFSLEEDWVADCASHITTERDENKVLQARLRSIVIQAKQVLPPGEYDVFRLRNAERLLPYQIAEKLGISHDAVRQRLSRANLKIRKDKRFF